MPIPTGFTTALDATGIAELAERARRTRGDILTMTTLAASGHPGGSMSSAEILTLVYARMDRARDAFVISCGHLSPGVYSALGRAGFIDVDEAITKFRKAGSRFAGHVETVVEGVVWDTGNLGQGLSAACAFAHARKLRADGGAVFCLMGDGEQQKGQQAEARDLAAKLRLDNLVAFVDRNGLQISGPTGTIMPQDIAALYRVAGWNVEEGDAHDLAALDAIVRRGLASGRPTCVIARSHMGQGVSFMVDRHEYHGSPLKEEQLAAALAELKLENRLGQYKARRAALPLVEEAKPREYATFPVEPGTPVEYKAGDKVALRDAYGRALADLARVNNAKDLRVIGVDCDLAVSTKLDILQKESLKDGPSPAAYLQVGIQEHNAATFAGALTREGYTVFWSTFGVFGVGEAYNQQRLNDLNHTRLKVALTHCGVDVGEDGKTHHAIDYVGLMRNFPGFEAIVPCDANQCDRAVRYAATREANVFLGMGRSKYPVLTREDGSAAFGGAYRFEYGRDEWLREGRDAVIVGLGHMAAFALEAHELLKKEGILVGVIAKASAKTADPVALEKAARLPLLVTLEDHNTMTGIGSVIAEWVANSPHRPRLIKLGVPRHASSGLATDLYRMLGLDGASVARTIRQAIGKG